MEAQTVGSSFQDAFLKTLPVFVGRSAGQGSTHGCVLFDAIMLNALPHTAGAVIKKGFLLLLSA